MNLWILVRFHQRINFFETRGKFCFLQKGSCAVCRHCMTPSVIIILWPCALCDLRCLWAINSSNRPHLSDFCNYSCFIFSDNGVEYWTTSTKISLVKTYKTSTQMFGSCMLILTSVYWDNATCIISGRLLTVAPVRSTWIVWGEPRRS